jgi:hypothetical protein
MTQAPLTRPEAKPSRWRDALQGAGAAGLGLVVASLLDHLLAGGLPPGAASGAALGSAAIFALLLLLPLVLVGALLAPLLARPRVAAFESAAAAALLFLAAWVFVLFVTDDRLPMRPGRFAWFHHGVFPSLALGLFVLWRLWTKTPARWLRWASRAWFVLCPWLALVSFSRYNKLYLQERLVFVLVLALVPLLWPLRARLWRAGLALLLLLGSWGVWSIGSPKGRDDMARAGRVSRALLRQFAPLARAAGHTLDSLQTRAAPASLPVSVVSETERALVQSLESQSPQNVILITVDALRADLGGLSSSEGIARLRAEGVSFSHSYSAATSTLEGVSGLFFGRFFFRGDLGESLAKRFQSKGVRTLTVQPIPHLSERGHSWITEDFDVYTHDLNYPILWGPIAKEETDLFLEKLDAEKGKPIFAWLHYYDPHHPYDAEGGTPQERYRGEVSRVDTQLARLLRELEARGYLENSLIIFSADHGEEFGEHGSETHGLTLYEPLSRVPLVIWAPGGAVRGVVESPVSTLWVPGLVAKVSGLLAPGFAPRGAFSDNLGKPVSFARRPNLSTQSWDAAIRAGRYKFIYSYDVEAAQLYELETDPGEENNLVDTEPAIAATLAARLSEELAR